MSALILLWLFGACTAASVCLSIQLCHDWFTWLCGVALVVFWVSMSLGALFAWQRGER